MHWLQATFANRFNKQRGERGHLFQGRYKALLVEEGEALGQVCHYIHLNPVRAGIATMGELAAFHYGSYWCLGRPKLRPPFLRPETALLEAGKLQNNPAGRHSYGEYLVLSCVS